MDWQKFKKLDYLAKTQDSSETCIVLFHGYGANAQDLASLSKIFEFGKPVDWIFPQGVLEIPGMVGGRAWFELRADDWDPLRKGKAPDQPMSENVKKTMNEVCELLNHLGKLYKEVVIGGFSQGAILSSHSFYRLNFSLKAMLLLSGFLVSRSEFPVLTQEQKVPFFQSHGRSDQVLAMSGARMLYDQLESMGLEGEWSEFGGGHEIPLNIISDMQVFLDKQLS